MSNSLPHCVSPFRKEFSISKINFQCQKEQSISSGLVESQTAGENDGKLKSKLLFTQKF